MKKILVSLGLMVALLSPVAATATTAPVCGYQCQYDKVYAQPNGSYWVQQRAAQAAYDAVYKYPTGSYWVTYCNNYGC